MVVSKDKPQNSQLSEWTSGAAKKRRNRRKKATSAFVAHLENNLESTLFETEYNIIKSTAAKESSKQIDDKKLPNSIDVLKDKEKENIDMSSKDTSSKSREEVLAAREAKKQAKQKGKVDQPVVKPAPTDTKTVQKKVEDKLPHAKDVKATSKGKDEVDRAIVQLETLSIDKPEKCKEQIVAERAAKKLAKQDKKKSAGSSDLNNPDESVADTITSIVQVAKEVEEVTAKPQESSKSKAELKAERRAKQEAQRAAKAAAQPAPKPKVEDKTAKEESPKAKPKAEEKPKPKGAEKAKPRGRAAGDWFQHLPAGPDERALTNVPLNSSLHPAVVRLGVRLATRAVTGSNARCVALLDALKKMIADYTVPARTEFARGLEAALTAALQHVWAARLPSAPQVGAVKCLRHHLARLDRNVPEYEAKKYLQEEIDRYIREQVDMAGEAISIAVRKKISPGDHILTYGCSSLIERILLEAHAQGVRFTATVCGGRETARRLARAGVRCAAAGLRELYTVMPTVNKVLLGASSFLANGSLLAPAGTCQTALAARAFNVPALVCCETHKCSEQVHTDTTVYNELGDPDALLARVDESSPLRAWRDNPNLSLLNLTYDVTPPSLLTAVVTELAILPCTSAPVVLRFKLSEYGV